MRSESKKNWKYEPRIIMEEFKMVRHKTKLILAATSFLLLTGCSNSSNVNTAYDIRDNKWNEAVITTAASDNTAQEHSTQASAEPETQASNESASVVDDGVYRYQGYVEGETVLSSNVSGETWTWVYNTKHPKRKNEKYGEFGETITYNGYELTVTEAVYTKTFNTLYDMVDKKTADSYISYIKDKHSLFINSDNTFSQFSKNDTVQDMLRGGYRMGVLLVRCRIKNVSSEARDIKVTMARGFDITDSGDTLEGSFGCSFFLGQYDPVTSIYTGLTEKDQYISLEPDEEREVILVGDLAYTMDKLVNYGRDYALDRTVYLSSQFLVESYAGDVDIPEGAYLIPLIDHGVVCGSGQKLE